MPVCSSEQRVHVMKAIENFNDDKTIIEWPVYMQRALDLAQNVFCTPPNPRVGCVIVCNQQIVGQGWHVAAGQPHAEVMALEQAKEQARSGTAFVSLEPCSFTGRTGPCSKALTDAGIKAVVIAGLDPNPRVSGSGVKQLEEAGIKVFHLPSFEESARLINPGYFKRNEKALPYVRLKLAMSLDGRTALANGESKWISGENSRADVQILRASSSAIITGVETVLKDDPALTVRPDELPISSKELKNNELCLAKQPQRVILDSQKRTPGTARILAGPGDVSIFTTNSKGIGEKLSDNVKVREVPAGERGVDLKSVLESLASELQCNDVLVEAGPTLSGSFLESGLVDELVVYIAPKLLGSDAKPLFQFTGLTSLADSKQFKIKELAQVGEDIKAVLTKSEL